MSTKSTRSKPRSRRRKVQPRMDTDGHGLKIRAAIAQLQRSERGRAVLRDFKTMFQNGAKALDSENQQALLNLTVAALLGQVDFYQLIP